MTTSQLKTTDYADFYATYINQLPNDDLLLLLKKSQEDTLNFFRNIPEEKLLFRYAESKWTIKEVLLHLIDTERILTYRALRFARNDATELPGFDQDAFVANSNANEISWEDLLDEYSSVRRSSIFLFKNFSEETLQKNGNGNGNKMTVAAAGFVVVGHEIHHVNVIKE